MTNTLPANTHEAALAENAMREAVAVVREAYGSRLEGNAAQWLFMLLTELLGLPERIIYPTLDRLELN